MAELADVAQTTPDEAAQQPAPASPRPTPTSTWGPALRRHAAAAQSTLTALARRTGAAIAGASPTTLTLAALGSLLVLSIIGSLAFQDALGITSAVLLVPILSAAIGAVAVRAVDGARIKPAAGEDARTVERTLHYVDAKLSTAIGQFGTERHNDAVIALFQAKAVTELCLGSEQSEPLVADVPKPTQLRRAEHSDRPAGLSLL